MNPPPKVFGEVQVNALTCTTACMAPCREQFEPFGTLKPAVEGVTSRKRAEEELQLEDNIGQVLGDYRPPPMKVQGYGFLFCLRGGGGASDVVRSG